jgi:tetratricopeptide (TPR) repeat protein
MLQKRILLAVSALALTFLLFILPKVVVDNDENSILSDDVAYVDDLEDESADTFNHGVEMNENLLSQISDLRESLGDGEINKNSITFADSLVLLFREGGKLDSAAKYLEWKAINFPNEGNLLSAGLGYYEAFGFAVDRKKLNYLGGKTRNYLNQILTENPNRLDLKAKIAMTYVSSSNPMQGILMLREVVEVDSNNVEAIFNLGLLSRQSSQFEKAVDRFEKLISIDESNIQARFLLGLSYLDINDKNNAKKHFEIIKNTTDDPAVLSTVEGYLKEIN